MASKISWKGGHSILSWTLRRQVAHIGVFHRGCEGPSLSAGFVEKSSKRNLKYWQFCSQVSFLPRNGKALPLVENVHINNIKILSFLSAWIYSYLPILACPSKNPKLPLDCKQDTGGSSHTSLRLFLTYLPICPEPKKGPWGTEQVENMGFH